VNKGTADKIDDAVEEFIRNNKSEKNKTNNNDNAGQNKEESDFEMIDSFSYDYDENNTITVGIMKNKKTKELSVAALAKYEVDNLGLMQYNSTDIRMYPLINGFDLSFSASVGGEYYYYMLNDGKLVLNTLPKDVAEFPAKYEDSAKEVLKMVDDLYKKYGIER
ncbi:MAG: hypothetical protein NC489_44830, partial [Ruminococcus flavefaciens]|nr:hypothetical protein [Ruminococcus flavefaciens]